MDHNSLRKLVEGQPVRLEGNTFQDRMDRLGLELYVWRFLTNDTLPGEVDQFIDNELRPLHPDVIIEVWGLKTLADEISKLKREQVDRIIDVVSAAEPKPKPPEKPQVVQLNHMQTGEISGRSSPSPLLGCQRSSRMVAPRRKRTS
ncbi:hypothetical protein ACFVXW_16165 [Streptomyces sp. NPDC058251]|uniref:hypothetical protein n=1 Tax=unclassified Streptomyces TaxID=2593676 RepID=UPI00365770BA